MEKENKNNSFDGQNVGGLINAASKEFIDPEDQKIIDGWKQELNRIEISEAFMGFSETRKLREIMEKNLETLNSRILENRARSREEEAARWGDFGQREVVKAVLAFLTRDTEKDRESLHSSIVDMVEESENNG